VQKVGQTFTSFGRGYPTDKHIQNKGLHICYMCMLCEKSEESI